ncbi:MAG: CoA pyrophosphatase [Burkholderiales bacterium]|nr:CoA pyrophosphatase [Burkholderiales bacterium]MDQ3197151.1 CoA pyrophosphatase [Pseudomonadota bacterium]
MAGERKRVDEREADPVAGSAETRTEARLPFSEASDFARGIANESTRETIRRKLAAVNLTSNASAPSSRSIPAAVLVPLANREDGVTILLTQRSPDLIAHAGQISFPGGCVEDGDEDRVATALREANEEVGLARGAIDVLGALPDYEVLTGFVITPVVGWIEPPIALRLQICEVAEVFEVPLAFFLDPANHRRLSHSINGASRDYWTMPFEGRHIWGATAAILVSLYEVLRSPAP